MLIIHAVDRHGSEHQLTAPEGGTLMEQLRDLSDGVAAICGGMCSCATCHVYVDPEWLEQLVDPGDDERQVLADVAGRRATSRLSCQILLDERLSGLRVTIAPEE
jgi:ferredoxin, 2Fe-2S